MMSFDTECRWPELPKRTDIALREAVDYILDRFDVLGFIVAGTHISGTPHANSDLDVVVIHEKLVRQRIQKRFNGVATEIFVNPPTSIRRYFEAEVRRPSTAHMLATGFVVLDVDPVVEQLRTEAREWLDRPLALNEAELTALRYAAADAYENAHDIRYEDPATALRILHHAVSQMIDYAFLTSGQTLPRAKRSLQALVALDPKLGQLARRYYEADATQQFALAAGIAELSIGEIGFFEWESTAETIN